jgi:hypothetical protein
LRDEATPKPPASIEQTTHGLTTNHNERSDMKLFNAHIDGVEFDTLIIARCGSHAADIFVTYWAGRHGSPPEEFEIFQSDAPGIKILRDLTQLIASGTSGIVHFDEAAGFTLEPM